MVDSKRIQFIRDFSEKETFLGRSLFRAFISCLTPSQVCKCLDLDFKESFSDWKSLIEKIAEDSSASFDECHHKLIDNLILRLPMLTIHERRRCALCLGILCISSPEQISQKIKMALLSSPDRSVRKQAYKLLRCDWKESDLDAIHKTWHERQDIDCAELLIKKAPDDYLIEHFEELRNRSLNKWFEKDLFIRVGKSKPDLLKYLEENDGITYSYVLVKLDRKLSEFEARKLLKDYANDERFALLIWCLGKMKLWSILEEIYN